MKNNKFVILGVAAAVLLAAGIWLSHHRSSQQANISGSQVFGDLEAALGQVTEVRLSKGDGSRTTLRKDAAGWTVVEREFPADPARVRELVLALARLRVVEQKTSDPANYAKLGVETPDTPAAASTLVEVVAGAKVWVLIAGKVADNRAVYVRKPKDAASALAAPFFNADPDQKRWVDRLITDIPGASVHEVAVQMGKEPSYLLTRAKKGDPDITLTPVPKGRTAASTMVLAGQSEVLSAFNFDDVRKAGTTPPTDSATLRAFDGQVFEFKGHREGGKGFVTLNAHRDATLAAQFAAPAPVTGAKEPASKDDLGVERLATRTQGVEFEIPLYKYEALFKPLEQLLEPKAGTAAKPPGAK